MEQLKQPTSSHSALYSGVARESIWQRSELALEAAEADIVACAHLTGQSPNMVETFVRSAAAQSLMHAESDISVSLTNIREIVRKMGTLSGE